MLSGGFSTGGSPLNVESPQSRCLFGHAHCDITPPVGIYHRMWGAASHDRSTGIHDRLFADAMVFAPLKGDKSARQVVVTMDHCLLWATEMADLRAAVCDETGLPSEQVLFTFSHTHAAGLMGYERVGLPGGDLIPEYLSAIASKLSEIILNAVKRLQPCCLTYVTGRCSLAANRDFWDAQSNQYVCGYNPAGQADDTVMVARVTDSSGNPKAVIVNYACHPTTLAWQNTLISPDFIQSLRLVVEDTVGGDVACVFLQGASGDLGPRVGFVGDTRQAERNGRQLGYAVLSALEACDPPETTFTYEGPVISGATIGVWNHRPLTDQQKEQKQVWQRLQRTIELDYRDDLITVEQCAAEREQWQQTEQQALSEGREQEAKDARAIVERLTRKLHRLKQLPEGKRFPFPINVWRIGDGVWVAVEGEHYQDLQLRLREQFPNLALFVVTLANGSRCSYLPPADSYGKGIYQETVSILAPGCLERVIESVSDAIRQLYDSEYIQSA